MKRVFASFCLALLALMTASPAAYADKSAYYTGRFSDVAVGGYDLVSFFSEAGPSKGDDQFSTEIEGATFKFSSQANLDAYLASPETYPLAYGGYCAWAVAEGKLAKGNPKHWNVVDGTLYLNYNGSIKKKWEKDIPGFIKTADKNWPEILKD